MEVDGLTEDIGVDDFNIDYTDNIIEYSEEHLSSEGNSELKDFEDENETLNDRSDEVMEEERLDVDEDDEEEEILIPSPPKPLIKTRPAAVASSSSAVRTPVRTQQKISAPVKIAAKPTTAGVAVKSGGGQILIIQSPNGTQQTIRLSGANAQNLSSGGYQLIKTPKGNLIQIRKKSSSNNTKDTHAAGSGNAPTETAKKIITHQKTAGINTNTTGKLIYKGMNVKGNEQQIMLSTSPTKVPATIVTSSNGTTTTQTKTLSLSEVQQLGLLGSNSGKVKQVMIAQKGKDGTIQSLRPIQRLISGSKSPNTPSPQVLTHAVKKITPIQPKVQTSTTTLNRAGQIVKKLPVPTSLIKVSPGSGIQQINIPGKGLQYVRFVSSSQTSTTNTPNTTTRVVAGPAAAKLLSSTGAGQKILIQGKSVTVVQSTSTSSQNKSALNTSGTKMISVAQPSSKVNVATKIQQSQQPQRRIVPLDKYISSNPAHAQKIIAMMKVKEEKNTSETTKNLKVTTITQSQLSQMQAEGRNKNSSIVMLPPNFMKTMQTKVNPKIKTEEVSDLLTTNAEHAMEIDVKDDGDAGRKKPCNCTKSQCLKLYCDCFANGEFCSNCNCRDCSNNLENEEERQKAIRICLERNPNAFRPKIGKAKDKDQSLRHHTKGCNCKRSGCLKNYCECYEAKISCSSNCKCHGCRNTDEFVDRPEGDVRPSRRLKRSQDSMDKNDEPTGKQPHNFMTPEVIDATVQCMVAQAEECQRRGVVSSISEKLILEEFGRCLVEIIDFSIRNTNDSN